MIDCVNVTAIDIPASVVNVSFRETSRMKNLEFIVLRAAKPIDTGFINGNGKFFFELMNPNTQIVVQASSKKLYENALAVDAGEYSDSKTCIPFVVNQGQLPTKKNIKGVKNFDKY